MKSFVFPPDRPIEVLNEPKPGLHYPARTYRYTPKRGKSHWYVTCPNECIWLPVLTEGVPPKYQAEVLLLTTAYQ